MFRVLLVFVVFVTNIVGQKCTCTDDSTCRVWGDPHLESFYGFKKRVNVIDDVPLNIYTYGDFSITATTFGKDLMDEIKFGDLYIWHKSDCDNNKKLLPIKTFEFPDGSYVICTVRCAKSGRRKNKKIHLNLVIQKFIETDSFVSFKEYETKIPSNGVCTHLL